MTDPLDIALISAGAAIAGGALSGAYQHFRDRLERPVLELDHQEAQAYFPTANYQTKDGKEVVEIFVRARVHNTGFRVARECRVFLTNVEEVHHSGTTKTAFHDSMPLSWPLGDFSARDIPKGVELFVDVVSVFRYPEGWNFKVPQLYSSQQGLKTYRGTYRLTLLATAANALPSKPLQIDATYQMDWNNFRAVAVPRL